MRKTITLFRVLFLGIFLLFSGCSSDSSDPADVPIPDAVADPKEEMTEDPPPVTRTLEQRVQDIVDSKVGPGKLFGVSMSIRVNGTEQWSFKSGDVEKNMRFGIASITKTVVAATIMKLEEEGKLSLDDPISKWLTLNSPNVDEAITIFQLLNHLAGLKGYFQHPDIWPRVEGDLNAAIDPIEIADYVGEPIFAPGDRYEYSNSNYLLLGLIIEAVTQKTVGEVMREKFWGPLQLNEMYFGANENIEGPIATAWRDSDGDGVLEDISGEFGPAYHSVFFTAADVFSTASDLSMWAHQLFAGDAVSVASREKMLTFLDLEDPIANGYGLGIRRVLLANRNTWGHTGGMRGYGSYMFYEPVSKVSIAMLNNQSRSENGPLLRYELVQETLLEVFAEL